MEKLALSLTDKLAVDRTNLANERTFLAYFRTFIVFLSSGLAIIKLDILLEIRWVGVMLTTIAPVLFLIGLFRFLYVKRRIKKYYL
jgi:putative membrane protein